MAQQKVEEVYIAFSSPGGQVAQGVTLYNFIRGLPFEVIAHNIGNVDSIGNAVFLAADKRFACVHSTFMFHGVGFDKPASRYERKELQGMLDGIESDESRIAGIITDRTQISEKEAQKFFMLAQTKSAEFARDRGIVDDIREFHLPRGVPVVSFVFKR